MYVYLVFQFWQPYRGPLCCLPSVSFASFSKSFKIEKNCANYLICPLLSLKVLLTDLHITGPHKALSFGLSSGHFWPGLVIFKSNLFRNYTLSISDCASHRYTMPIEKREREWMWPLCCISLANHRSVRNEIKEKYSFGPRIGFVFQIWQDQTGWMVNTLVQAGFVSQFTLHHLSWAPINFRTCCVDTGLVAQK